jgi:hypothetical protein
LSREKLHKKIFCKNPNFVHFAYCIFFWNVVYYKSSEGLGTHKRLKKNKKSLKKPLTNRPTSAIIKIPNERAVHTEPKRNLKKFQKTS